MPAAKDILLDNDGDLFIDSISGDFSIGLSDEWHIQDIIQADKGWYKEFPSLGVGIEKYLNSSGTEQEIVRNTKLQLQSDGYNVKNTLASFDGNGELILAPNATRD